MADSRIKLAIEATHPPQTTVDAPASVTATTTTAIIIGAQSRNRTVLITNIGAVDAFLAIAVTAEDGKGISLLAGESKTIQLDDGLTLSALSTATTTDLSWQSYGG